MTQEVAIAAHTARCTAAAHIVNLVKESKRQNTYYVNNYVIKRGYKKGGGSRTNKSMFSDGEEQEQEEVATTPEVVLGYPELGLNHDDDDFNKKKHF
jgi:hypothetical protein